MSIQETAPLLDPKAPPKDITKITAQSSTRFGHAWTIASNLLVAIPSGVGGVFFATRNGLDNKATACFGVFSVTVINAFTSSAFFLHGREKEINISDLPTSQMLVKAEDVNPLINTNDDSEKEWQKQLALELEKVSPLFTQIQSLLEPILSTAEIDYSQLQPREITVSTNKAINNRFAVIVCYIQNLKIKAAVSAKQVQELEGLKKEAEEQLQSAKAHSVQNSELVQGLQEQISSLEQKNQTSEAQRAGLESALKKAQEDLQSAKAQSLQNSELVQGLQEKISSLEQENQASEAQRAGLENALKKARTEFAAAQKKSSTQIAAKEQRVEQLKKTLEEKEDLIKKLNGKIQASSETATTALQLAQVRQSTIDEMIGRIKAATMALNQAHSRGISVNNSIDSTPAAVTPLKLPSKLGSTYDLFTSVNLILAYFDSLQGGWDTSSATHSPFTSPAVTPEKRGVSFSSPRLDDDE